EGTHLGQVGLGAGRGQQAREEAARRSAVSSPGRGVPAIAATGANGPAGGRRRRAHYRYASVRRPAKRSASRPASPSAGGGGSGTRETARQKYSTPIIWRHSSGDSIRKYVSGPTWLRCVASASRLTIA